MKVEDRARAYALLIQEKTLTAIALQEALRGTGIPEQVSSDAIAATSTNTEYANVSELIGTKIMGEKMKTLLLLIHNAERNIFTLNDIREQVYGGSQNAIRPAEVLLSRARSELEQYGFEIKRIRPATYQLIKKCV